MSFTVCIDFIDLLNMSWLLIVIIDHDNSI